MVTAAHQEVRDPRQTRELLVVKMSEGSRYNLLIFLNNLTYYSQNKEPIIVRTRRLIKRWRKMMWTF
jgi:hypothetical protein